MSLTGLHTDWISSVPSYENDRDYLLKVAENDKLLFGQTVGLTPYYDGKSIAIGYGFDLLENDIAYVKYFLGTIGIILTQAQENQIIAARANPSAATAAELGQFLNLGSDWTTGEPRASTLLRNVLENDSLDANRGKEKLLETFLTDNQIVLGASREKAVLVSMWYQAAGQPGKKGGYFLNKDGTLTNMVRALQKDDRAEVWYQIRYGSSNNGADGLGVVKRRYFEADYFGLYDSGITQSNMNDENAKGAFRTYTRHQAQMNTYEVSFSDQIAAANTAYHIDVARGLQEDLEDARTYLVDMYVTQKGINTPINGDILVGEDTTTSWFTHGQDADLLEGSDDNDLIFGESGKDILVSRGGDDVLYGGDDQDVLDPGTAKAFLFGGKGADVYRITALTDDITIKDEDGKGIIVFDPDNEATGLMVGVREADDQGNYQGPYKTPDPSHPYQVTYSWSGADGDPLTITVEGQIGHVIVQNFKRGDLGINLIDLPRDPQPTKVVDLNVDPDQSQIGPESELILGTGDDDDINAQTGGADHILGGAGDDLISAGSDNDLLEGGSGRDILRGASGNDHLIGGIDDPSLDTDDALVGGVGDDFLEGGGGDDVLAGGPGKDILVGGSGNDHLRSASTLDPIDRTWSVTGWPVTSSGGTIDYNNFSGDIFFVDDKPDVLFGGEGLDLLFGSQGADVLYGGPGNDSLFGDLGDDTLLGGSGADALSGGFGNDFLFGGDGIDFLAGDDTNTGSGQPGDDYLDGGRGPDRLFGRGGNDILLGGEGADELQGEEGDDILYGGDDGDTLVGGPGADILFGGPGDDMLYRDNADILVFNAGDGFDLVSFGEGGGTIALIDTSLSGVKIRQLLFDGNQQYMGVPYGSEVAIERGFLAADQVFDIGGTVLSQEEFILEAAPALVLRGTDEADTVFGGRFGDILFTSAGADTLKGGPGDDSLDGGIGDDTYLFNRGDGADKIADYDPTPGNTDRIVFGADITPNDVTAQRLVDDLVLSITGTADSVRVRQWFTSPEDEVERIEFADGTLWDADFIRQAVIQSTAGADIITGYETDDVLDGGAGNDTLIGKAGNDTYVFGRDSGQDTIIDNDPTPGNIDTLSLAADVSPADVTLRRNGDDLRLTIVGTTDSVTVKDWFKDDSPDNQVEQIAFTDGSGTVWDVATIKDLVLQGTPGDDTLIGYASADTLDGGAGNDTLIGKAGNDTYVFGRGYGRDVITDTDATPGNIDAVVFTPDVLPTDVGLRRDGADLHLVIDDTGDNLVVTNWFDTEADRIEEIRFDNGTVWDVDTILSVFTAPTDTDDVIVGTNGPDVLLGGGGNDALFGFGGNDRLYGGEGHDSLSAGEGSDFLDGGPGNDSLSGFANDFEPNILVGGSGDDFIDTGRGSDVVIAGPGNDEVRIPFGGDPALGTQITIVFTRGDGFDRVLVDDEFAGVPTENIVVFGPGIAPTDLTVQTGFIPGEEEIQRPKLAVGLGDGVEDALLLEAKILSDDPDRDKAFSKFPYPYFLFADGQVLTLAEVLAREDGEISPEGTAGDDVLVGSVWRDSIFGGDGNDKIRARSREDFVDGGAGDDVISAGAQNDTVFGGTGDDVIAGESGDDLLQGEGGSDVYVFNRGDGNDVISDANGDPTLDIDTLSFGVDISPADISAYVNQIGQLVLLIAGSTDIIGVDWFDPATGTPETENRRVERVQFLDESGNARIFDLAGIVSSLTTELLAADETSAVSLFTDATSGFELAGLTIAGGDFALAYAQTGDLFKVPTRQSGGAGDDVISGGPGDDVIDAGDGDNIVDAGNGDNTVTTGDGNDRITTGSGIDIIFAGGGDNVIVSGAGNDIITLGQGSDTVDAGDGDDLIFIRPPGVVFAGIHVSKVVHGGYGNDSYVYNPSPGGLSGISYWLGDISRPGALNKLLFGPGLSSDGLVVGYGGSVIITVPETGDEIHLANFNPNDALGPHAIEFFEFADGTTLTYAQLIARGFDALGTEADDILTGTNVVERISGLGGNDTFIGSPGNDQLNGGAGDDTYVFGLGDGSDVITDASGTDQVTFGPGIGSTDLTVTRNGDDLLIALNADDAIAISGWFVGQQIEQFTFDDGTVLAAADVEALIASANEPPVVANPLSDQNVTEFEAFGFQVPADTFTDPDVGDTLTLSAALADGNPLPAWLSFDAAMGAFSGTPDRNDVGSVDVTVTATDSAGAAVSDVFSLTVNQNPAITAGTDGDDVINGTDSADIIHGLGGNDIINGKGGMDQLFGDAGDDTLNGDDGADTLDGGPGNDTLFGGIGPDVLIDLQGHNTLDGGAGSDSLTTGAGDDTLIGGIGADYMDAGEGTNTLDGGAGDDTLLAGAGDDVLIGGIGADYMDAGDGTNSLTGNDGADTLISGSGNDTLDGGVGADILDAGAGNDSLNAGDGNDTLLGGAGDDVLIAGIGADTLTGGPGNDTLDPGDGFDTTNFGLGDDHDIVVTVDGNGAPHSGKDTVAFGSGVTPEQLWFQRQGDDLIVSILGTTDDMTIDPWYRGADETDFPMSDFRTNDGSVLLDTQVEQLVQAMAQFIVDSGSESLPLQMPDELQPVIAAAWDTA